MSSKFGVLELQNASKSAYLKSKANAFLCISKLMWSIKSEIIEMFNPEDVMIEQKSKFCFTLGM